MEKLILFGNGSVAEVLHYHFTRERNFEVVAFTVDRPMIRGDTFHDLPLVPWDEIASRYPPEDYRMMIAVGYVQVNKLRAKRFHEAREMGYRMVSYVSPSASIWDGFTMGQNCRINQGVNIQPFAHIGDNVFIGSNTLIGHHSLIKDHCHLSANVQIAGHVSVEPYCYIGINATIRNSVVIAPSCIIGAGAVILGDTVEKGVYMTHPADLLPISSDQLSPK